MMNDRQQMNVTAYLGQLIEQRRKDLKMSQEFLASEAGISRSYLSDIERGLRNISVITLIRLAEALETSAADLLRKVEGALSAALISAEE